MPPSSAGRDTAWVFHRRRSALIGLAFVVRLAIWAVIPTSRFASDEDSYFQAARTLLETGATDLFWPPVTGWLIAGVGWATGMTPTWVRLAWILMDLACLFVLGALARRLAPVVSGGDPTRADGFVAVVLLAYALYLPAISFAQFATSETPALLQTLLIVLIVSRRWLSAGRSAVAGLLMGTLILTRPSLLALAVAVPAGLVVDRPRKLWLRQAAIITAVAAAVVGSLAVHNWRRTGEITIAHNSAYNLFIGNREVYAEDLNLFSPRATAEQIEFRRQLFAGTLEYPTDSPAELQRKAIAAILDRPGLFLRRALGRLARVFVPKTDVLELVGGEQRAGALAPASLVVMGLANLQWAVGLFGGLVGLTWFWRAHRPLGALLASVVAGSLPFCLVAISKPRYAFVFEPILLLAACAFLLAPRSTFDALGRSDRWVIALGTAFILWGWAAWLIFGLSSRQALAGA